MHSSSIGQCQLKHDCGFGQMDSTAAACQQATELQGVHNVRNAEWLCSRDNKHSVPQTPTLTDFAP